MSDRFPQLGPSGHVDDFARRNLPPFQQWPELLLERPEFRYPDYLNAAVELTDRLVEKGFGDRVALIGNGRQRTYKELTDWSNRLAHALVENYGVKPGNRVLIRSGNNPALVAAWLAATKAGAVVVNTMPMLRAGELTQIIDKAEIALALTDSRIADELVACAKTSRFLKQVVNFDGTSNHDAELDRVALSKPVRFEAVKTGRDDVALLGFTSGTTGEPKATMHFHRDLLVIADGYAKEVLQVTSAGESIHLRGSGWSNFPRVLCEAWSHANVVLMGDAAATAHFSIGSGTKLAMESAISMASYLHTEPTMQAALAKYEDERRTEVLRLQSAARNSMEWFEDVERYLRLDPVQFNYSLLTRSQRISHENLRLRDRNWLEAAEARFSRLAGAEDNAVRRPMVAPFQLRDMRLKNRVVVSPMAQYKAVDGCPTDWH